MSYHAGTIHTVRFSGNGLYLASGADDKNVCIYKLDSSAPPHAAAFGTFCRIAIKLFCVSNTKTALGSSEAPPVENWKIVRRLIGHENDVQDLGWSNDSSILVSVGLDSKIVVWSGHTFEKLKTLVSHQSHVKGLTFDPANKYFATASDDRTIKIWRFQAPGPNSGPHDQVNNFVLEATVSQPFKASPLTTYFRRCSWSPDGNHVAAANAVNGPVSSVAIINRGTWDGDIHLIGHEGPVEVCAFSPRLFSNVPPSAVSTDASRPAMVHTVIACAGQDKSLTVWITTNPRPLVIIKELARKSVSDLAWTPDGKTLYAACLDGSILMVQFEHDELGHEAGLEENEKSLAKFGAGRRGAGMVEGTEGLLLEEKSKEGEMKGAEGRMGALMGDSAPSNIPATNGIKLSGPLSNGVNGVSTNGHTDTAPVEKHKEDSNAAIIERIKSKVTIGKDGKKRVAPTLVSSASGNVSSLPKPQLMSSRANQGAASDAPQSILDLSKPFDGLPQGGLGSLLLGNRRRLALLPLGAEDDPVEKRLALSRKDGAVPIVVNKQEGLVPAKGTPAPSGQIPTPDFIRPAVTNPSLLTSQVRLAVPKLRPHIVRTLESSRSNKSSTVGETEAPSNPTEVMMEARNPTQLPATGRPQDQEPCRIVVTKRGQPVFQDYLPRSALLLTGNKDFWSVACEDGTIYAWTPMGRRLINAIVLESQPVVLDCRNRWLLCITAVGMCYVWDLNSLSSPQPPVSLAPILDIASHGLQDHPTRGAALTGARLNSEGRIVVTLTNGEGFAYNPQMYVWQRLSELWWMVGSQYWNSTDSSVGDLKANSALGDGSSVSAGIIPFLERSTTNATLARGRAGFLSRLVRQLISREGFEGFESGVSVAHLENRLAAALMLGAKDDFQVYLYMYARRIGAEGLKLKVEELLRGLIGGLSEQEGAGDISKKINDRYWNDESHTLCGWPRQELMRHVVLILGLSPPLPPVERPCHD